MRQPGPEQRRLHRTRSRRQTGQCRPRGQEEGGQRQGEAPRGKKRKEEVKRVQDLEEESSSDDDEGTDSEGEEADKQVRIVHKVRKVDDQGKERQSRWVTIRLATRGNKSDSSATQDPTKPSYHQSSTNQAWARW